MGSVTPAATGPQGGLTPPAALSSDHGLSNFSCGNAALDDWLKYRAIKAEGRSARTYVTCFGRSVVGYYCFASSAVRIDELPKRMRRNVPPLVPMILIGRLAVDRKMQRLGVGSGLLKDALSRALQASRIIGTRGVMVHAIDQEAAAFYASYGFQVYPEGAQQTFFTPIETIMTAAVG